MEIRIYNLVKQGLHLDICMLFSTFSNFYSNEPCNEHCAEQVQNGPKNGYNLAI